MSAPTRMEVAVARELCNRQADSCNVDREDLWKTYSEEFYEDARAVLCACGAPALLQAAKAVAYSNGFDAAYPDKLEALRAAVKATEVA
jgi:hypothetical protein